MNIERKLTKLMPDVAAHGGEAILVVQLGAQTIRTIDPGHTDTSYIKGTRTQTATIYGSYGQYAGNVQYQDPNDVQISSYVPGDIHYSTLPAYRAYIVVFDSPDT